MKMLQLTIALLVLASVPYGATAQPGDWTFSVGGEMRRYIVYQDIHGWDHACQAMLAAGPGAFLVSPGDIDQEYTSNPPGYAYDIVEQEIGPGFPFFPGVGNHEAEYAPTMEWIRGFDMGGPAFAVNPGPAGCETTTYSWDHGDCHFVMLNQCFDEVDDIGEIDGNWNPTLDAWLTADLSANTKPIVFVFGHFPAFPQPDRDTGLSLHAYDTSFNIYNDGEYRDAFWSTLQAFDVTAYVCGHSHVSSVVKIDGIWQIDQGHARGPRGQDYHGPSTFMRFLIGADGSVDLETWRQPYTEGVGNEAPYTLWHTDTIREAATAVPATPSALRIADVWPNPFNPSVTIRIEVDEAAAGRLEIFDMKGRTIRILHDGEFAKGSGEFVWDGSGAKGRALPSGSYRVVLSSGNERQRRTISLLR